MMEIYIDDRCDVFCLNPESRVENGTFWPNIWHFFWKKCVLFLELGNWKLYWMPMAQMIETIYFWWLCKFLTLVHSCFCCWFPICCGTPLKNIGYLFRVQPLNFGLWLQAMARASEELIRLVLVPDGTRVDVDGTSCWHQEKHSCWFSNKNKGYLMLKASNQSFFGGVLN